jgi:hypothetical protein
MSNLGETLTRVSKRLRAEGYTSKDFNPPRRPRASMRPRAEMEAKTSVMVTILLENNPQSMLTENEQNLILKELVYVCCKTHKGGNYHTLHPSGGAFSYMYTKSQLKIEYLGQGPATDARNLPKLITAVLSMRNRFVKSLYVHTEHWSVLRKYPELKDQQLILFIDWD